MSETTLSNKVGMVAPIVAPDNGNFYGGPLNTGPSESAVSAFDQAERGLKFNQGKAPLHLLDSYAIYQTAQVLAFGARKYAAHNWRKGIPLTELLDSAGRHLLEMQNGVDADPESGLHHAAHLMCNAMMILAQSKYRPEMDDRFNPEIEGAH